MLAQDIEPRFSHGPLDVLFSNELFMPESRVLLQKWTFL